jgi:hypothetical protein
MKNFITQPKKNSLDRQNIALIVALLTALAIYLIFQKDYGLSRDEMTLYQYSAVVLDAVKKFILGLPFDHLFHFSNLEYYGTAYLLPGAIIVNLLQRIFPSIDPYAIWHTLNFITFLCGAEIIYQLSKRFVSKNASLFASLLYLTQPLLWGHGVMNPKDIPFMVFFAGTIAVGIISVDQSMQNRAYEHKHLSIHGILQKHTLAIIFISLISFLCLFDRITGNHFSQLIFTQSITKIQTAPAGSFFSHWGQIFSAGITHGITIEDYVAKIMQWINAIEFLVLVIVFLAIFLAFFIKSSPSTRWLILASLLLAITTDIRVGGPAAGGLVSLYAILKLKKKAFRFILAYLGPAFIAIYLFWPYLWTAPFDRFFTSLSIMNNFPWEGTVRFNGNDYPASSLPRTYLPVLLGIQFTLPLLLLALAGMILSLFQKRLQKENGVFYSILAIWFMVPLLLVVLVRPNMYDNFRQFLFITPPLFLFAAVGFEQITSMVELVWLRAGISLALLLPGLIAAIWLHPYEYIYYNGVVGWTGNIGNRFEADYWGTSLCQAGDILSKNAAHNSLIAFTNPVLMLTFKECESVNFDLRVERVEHSNLNPNYAVLLVREGDDQDYYRSMQPYLTIGRGHTPFLVIKTR